MLEGMIFTSKEHTAIAFACWKAAENPRLTPKQKRAWQIKASRHERVAQLAAEKEAKARKKTVH